MSQSKPHFHADKLKQRKTQRKKNKEARAAAKKRNMIQEILPEKREDKKLLKILANQIPR